MLHGSIPLRAYRFCEPFVQASGYGWTFFSPIDFTLIWDGNSFFWKPAGATRWSPLGTAQMPGYSNWFSQNAPEKYQRLEIPFLTAFPERGVVQIWTGFAAVTSQDWSLLIRGPANLARSSVFHNLEGIVEHDWWFGPVIGNLQFTKADCEVRFTQTSPILLAQPVPREAYSAEMMNSAELTLEMGKLTYDDWEELESALFFGTDNKPVGSYAKVARKRGR
jgi:hypothetical protein